MIKFFCKTGKPRQVREYLDRVEVACKLEAAQMAARVALGDRALVPPQGKPSRFRYQR